MNIQVLALVVLYFVLLVVILPLVNRSRVYSPFSAVSDDFNTLIENQKFHHRVLEAKDYFSTKNEEKSKTYHQARYKHQEANHLIIVIIKKVLDGKGGPSAQHLLQLSASMDEIVHENEDYGLVFCDASNNTHPALPVLSGYFQLVTLKMKNFWSSEETLKHAFLDCVDFGSNLMQDNIKFITVFNENVLPYANFAGDLRDILQSRLESKFSFGEMVTNSGNWLFLHLHEPIGLRHFQFSFTCLKEFIFIFMTGAVTFYGIFRVLDRYLYQRSLLLSFLYGGVLFITFAICMGRPYLSELRRFSSSFYDLYDPPEPIFFSALTMSLKGFQKMKPHIKNVTCSSATEFHELLDSLINSLEIPGYVLSPSLVRYV